MSVSYTQEERNKAREIGQHLATIAVAGMEFAGLVSDEERDEIAQYLLDFQRKRRARAAEKAAAK